MLIFSLQNWLQNFKCLALLWFEILPIYGKISEMSFD